LFYFDLYLVNITLSKKKKNSIVIEFSFIKHATCHGGHEEYVQSRYRGKVAFIYLTLYQTNVCIFDTLGFA